MLLSVLWAVPATIHQQPESQTASAGLPGPTIIEDFMQDIPKFSEATIRQYAAGDSYSRGQQYYRQGAVTGLVLRDNSLQAEVEGSDYEPYKVRVSFDAGGITAA